MNQFKLDDRINDVEFWEETEHTREACYYLQIALDLHWQHWLDGEADSDNEAPEEVQKQRLSPLVNWRFLVYDLLLNSIHRSLAELWPPDEFAPTCCMHTEQRRTIHKGATAPA